MLGGDAAGIFEQAGVKLTGVDDERISAASLQQVWRLAVSATDDGFGIQFARSIQPVALHGLGFSWMASQTLRQSLERLVRFFRLLTTAGDIELHEEQGQLRLWFRLPVAAGIAAPASIDGALAMFVHLCRISRGDSVDPVRVSLQRPRPVRDDLFAEFFGCDPEYDAPENCLWFDLNLLDQPLPMANAELARANDQIVMEYLARLQTGSLQQQIRHQVIESLPSGLPDLDEIAQQLNMSSRTLQRRLKEEGLTYKQLLEETRAQLAQQYLSNSQRSIGEVSYLLGFTEPSNFIRAFRRWTGETPAQYRQSPVRP